MTEVRTFDGLSSFIHTLDDKLEKSAIVIKEEDCKSEFNMTIKEGIEAVKLLGLCADGVMDDEMRGVIFARKQKHIDDVFAGKADAMVLEKIG